MLKVIVPPAELYDESTETFIVNTKPQELQLEHSLVSISKWESFWKKPFLTKTPMTTKETIDYVKCMTLTQNVDPMIYLVLPQAIIDQVSTYIGEPMTATTFNNDGEKKTNSEIVTSELIYYWMITMNIPMECQKWHLNRLLTLINVCNIKNRPVKKMSAKALMARNAALNAERLKKLQTTG